MLDKNPKTRISATEALKHPFFAGEVKLLPRISNKEEDSVDSPLQEKNPINKTSIMMKNNNSPSMMANSPLMTSANPLKRNPGLLKDDSCLKFKMKETLMTGKMEGGYDSQDSIDSPQLKKNMLSSNQPKESRFCQEKRLQQRDTNREE
jgi:serine/threonine protein kinase